MEENESPSVKSIALKWGAINGAIGIIFFIVVDFLGLIGESWTSIIGLAIFLIIVVMAHKEYKSEGDGYMNYGTGLGVGTLTSVVSSIISSIFTFIYVSFINTEIPNMIREKQIMTWEDQGMDQAQIDQASSMMEMTTSPAAMLVFGIVGGVFGGFIVALIVTIFTKNQRPELS